MTHISRAAHICLRLANVRLMPSLRTYEVLDRVSAGRFERRCCCFSLLHRGKDGQDLVGDHYSFFNRVTFVCQDDDTEPLRWDERQVRREPIGRAGLVDPDILLRRQGRLEFAYGIRIEDHRR